jgi:hypothetical protein
MKIIGRKLIGDSGFDFPEYFYLILVPFFSTMWSFLLGVWGIETPIDLSVDTILNMAVVSLLSLVMYTMGIKPMKEYSRLMKFQSDIK